MVLIKSKSDLEGAGKLKNLTKEEILRNRKELLNWIQDMNWPVAKDVAISLGKYLVDLEDDLLQILDGDDYEWKYWIISTLFHFSDKPISNKIVEKLKELPIKYRNESTKLELQE